jgi:RHS repeat-associated protein
MEVAARSGTSETDLTFVGMLGYVKVALDKLFYVRARHLRPDLARWITVDPNWPLLPSYGYVNQRPCRFSDPLGLSEIGSFCWMFNEYVYNFCVSCYKNGPPSPTCQKRCDDLANEYFNLCGKGPRPPSSGWKPAGEPGIVPPPFPGGSSSGPAGCCSANDCDQQYQNCLIKCGSPFDWQYWENASGLPPNPATAPIAAGKHALCILNYYILKLSCGCASPGNNAGSIPLPPNMPPPNSIVPGSRPTSPIYY